MIKHPKKTARLAWAHYIQYGFNVMSFFRLMFEWVRYDWSYYCIMYKTKALIIEAHVLYSLEIIRILWTNPKKKKKKKNTA